GRGSGDAEATIFSNTPESYQSSLGLFRTMNSYYGRNGYSLRLEGLEAGVNDLAYQRAIVIHGADYVSEAFIRQTGRLGRSHGCPAVRQEVTYPLIDSIKEDHYLFVYYPDPEWLETSAFLSCDREPAQWAMN
ncbi:MAG: murein L,D-transpeptidase catalytic domain family protein, partial [Halomonas sp.]|nr:murein L,D-transpeptidase catalytic domain family protein [Halomonas sp.]